MMTRRDAILGGVARATEVHAKLGLREALANGDKPVDVLSAVQRLGLFVMFRPLDGLLGAYIPTRALAGMLITTKRDLHVQRFTAAHELGHHIFGHRALSLDKDIGFVSRGENTNHNLEEVEADSFAAEFLLPKWLIVAHLRRQKWTKSELALVDNVYQLSLRLGVSYAAMCWALLSQGLLDRHTVKSLLGVEPRTVKKRAVPGVVVANWRRDVWVLSERDRGSHILGGPDDLLVLSLEEHIASGYSWDVNGIEEVGLTVAKDERHDLVPERIGASVKRRLIMQSGGTYKTTHLHLEERRGWDKSQPGLNSFDLDLALVGREREGIPRIGRPLAA